MLLKIINPVDYPPHIREGGVFALAAFSGFLKNWDHSKHPTLRFMITSSLFLFGVHFFIWFVLCPLWDKEGAVDLFNHWDAGWYSRLAVDGYSGQNWAFFPLYPLVVGVFSWIYEIPPALVGVLVSSFLFMIFVFILAKTPQDVIAPPTRLAWLFFLLSPASYIFHSHHTESLYLILSFLAFFNGFQRKWLWAALFAGLCSLTRVQGSFVVIGLSVFPLFHKGRHLLCNAKTLGTFLLIATIGLMLFLLFPLYQYSIAGNPLLFLSAHDVWAHDSAGNHWSWLKAFWLGNPWQKVSFGGVVHNLYFFILLAGSLSLWRVHVPVAVYALLFCTVMPIQGEFVDVFRFGAVFFPVQFILAQHWQRARPPKWATLVMLAMMLAMNLALTFAYGISRWAY